MKSPPSTILKNYVIVGSSQISGQAALFHPSGQKSSDPHVRGQVTPPTGSPHLAAVHLPLPPSRVIEELHRALATKHRQDRYTQPFGQMGAWGKSFYWIIFLGKCSHPVISILFTPMPRACFPLDVATLNIQLWLKRYGSYFKERFSFIRRSLWHGSRFSYTGRIIWLSLT